MADRPKQATVRDSDDGDSRLSNPSPNPEETRTSSTPHEPICPNNYITIGQPVKRELHLLPQTSLDQAQTTNRYSATENQSARDPHTPPKPALRSLNVDTKSPDVYLALENLEAGLPKNLNEDSKSSNGSYVLTPTPTMTALPVTSPVSSRRRSSSSQRVSSQRYADIFGSKRWTTAQGSQDLPSTSQFNHRTYDKFRTRSGRYDRQDPKTNPGRHERPGIERSASDGDGDENNDPGSVTPDRYFDALQGPELNELKDKEELMLPKDELWPFLLRFPIGCFGVCLGLGSQSILWKQLALSQELKFLHIPLEVNLFLWCLALLTLILIFTTYSMKIIFYFEAVRREFFHPVRVNFFFAPWIAGMFLALGIPPRIAASVHPAVWCVFMAPILVLELKIYGQWLSGGKRRLSQVANPSTHLSVVGNFVGALLGAIVGWKEAAIFFWSVGLAHYLVLFVTLYQRLPTNESLHKDLHPVFFLFVAAPSTASVAWMHIVGTFDVVSRLVFFVALFLYTSLVVRINFFRGIRFSFAWWAYTFPMTAAAIASLRYSHVARSWITQSLAVLLSFISSATVLSLFFSTLLHGFVWRTLFQNDIAIAITAKRRRNLPKLGKINSDDLSDDSDLLQTLKNSEPLHKVMIGAIHNVISKDHSSNDEKPDVYAVTPDSFHRSIQNPKDRKTHTKNSTCTIRVL